MGPWGRSVMIRVLPGTETSSGAQMCDSHARRSLGPGTDAAVTSPGRRLARRLLVTAP